MKQFSLFRQTKRLETQVDQFLDGIIEVSLLFERAFKAYIKDGLPEDFDAALSEIEEIETRSDTLRREIESRLYEETLIPDLRGDVLSLLEDLGNLLGVMQANFYRFSIEQPELPSKFRKNFKELNTLTTSCVESVVMSARAYFRNIEAVRDHNTKVVFFEGEADKICTQMKRAVFQSDLPLERKIHLRYFIERVDEVANKSQDIAEYLAIYAIKRSM